MGDKDNKTILLDEHGDPVTIPESEKDKRRDGSLVQMEKEHPSTLIVVPLNENILFPGMTIPMVLESSSSQNAVEFAMTQGPYIALVPRIDPLPNEVEEIPTPHPREVSNFGVIGRALKMLNLPDGNRSVVVECIARVKITRYIRVKPFLIGRVEYPADTYRDTKPNKALWRAARMSLQELFKEIPGLPEGFNVAAANLDGPAQLTDFVAAHIDLPRVERFGLLSELQVEKRLAIVAEALTRELELARLAGRIRDDIREKVEKTQREYYLREQLKAIRRELGEEVDQKDLLTQELEEKIDIEGVPEEAAKRARKELKRLEVLNPESPEYNVIHTYLDWIISLPWTQETTDSRDLRAARRILDEDHYGLKEVKERIIEFLAVKKLKPERKGALLCFAGPPGVGKTSLGQSIARCLGRKFYRFSLGGMRDEAEIKGHRRTYIGAMPGKILQGLKSVEVRNPIFMLDEIDKLGSNSISGDPSSAMLEVLDPAQNHAFLDHYMDIPFDLSQVMFICTANVKANIPGPLLDRMEVIDIPGYIVDEKVSIAERHLVPRQIDANGLKPSQLKFSRTVLQAIIEGWTAEAGVRNLERAVGRVCRKVAAKVASGQVKGKIAVSTKSIPDYLGGKRVAKESLKSPKVGTAVGLAWTPVGGDILRIETTRMPGKGRFHVTGHLGDVMRESVDIAVSYIRANYKVLNVDHGIFEKEDLHVHFPAGAVPKDGPSAGVTITSALVSLLAGKKGVRPNGKIAMTGEMTLSGDVLPVGGIRDKVLAAQSAGVQTVIVPFDNQKDVAEIPKHTIKGLKFVYAKTYPDVLNVAMQL
ncbi:MAG: endopeptidase La [Deltaproteobacteria bacterium]|nr:endopeptidase La [Deltaproteobacteria bacterium]MBN2672256.1 endopeptidase La [Deltaproteobacteria bacterium]